MPDEQPVAGYGIRIPRGPIRARFDDARLALARRIPGRRLRAALTWRARPAVILSGEQHSRHGLDLGEPGIIGNADQTRLYPWDSGFEPHDGTVPVPVLPFPPPGGIGWHIIRTPPGQKSEPDEHGHRATDCGGAVAIPLYADGVTRRITRPVITFGEIQTYPPEAPQ